MTSPGQMPGRKLHAADRQASGRPIYNGASNAATFGTVDPTGYADRERRSGLAKALLGGTRPAATGRGGRPSPSGDPSMVGQTARRVDRRALVRTLAARLNAGSQRGA